MAFHWMQPDDLPMVATGDLREWVAGQPVDMLKAIGHVAIYCSPGDMTQYGIVLVDVRGDGMDGRPSVLAACDVYRSAYAFGHVEHGSWDYVGDKLKIPAVHETARIVLATVIAEAAAALR
jgi:hypothetical protein